MESTGQEIPHPPSDKQAAPKRIFYRTEFKVTLFLGLCVGASAYLLLHLAGKLGSMGQEGGNVAQIWSFIIAIVELGVSIAAIVISLVTQKKGTRRTLTNKEKRAEIAKHRPQFITAGVIAALLAFAVPPVVNSWSFRHISSQDIATKIQLKHTIDMTNGSTAEATLPTTKHKVLLLTLKLRSEQATGSCVAPARMKIDIHYNGSQGQTLYEVASGSQQRILLGDMSQPAKLVISLKNDAYCQVNLTIGSAHYRN